MGSYKKEEVEKLAKKGYIPVSHAAKKVSRSREMIYYLIRKGLVSYKRYAGIVYIHVPSLEKFYGK